MIIKRSTFLFLLCLLCTSAFAQTDLYGPEAPENVSYVRVVNATMEQLPEIHIGNTELEPLDPGEVSTYTLFEPGEYDLTVGERSDELTLEPETFTTIVTFTDELQVYDDEPLRDITRGLLTIYNFTSEPLSLHTEDGQEVFGDVAPRGSESITINEVTVGFEATVGQQVITIDERQYERGEAHSLFVFPGDEARIVYVRATP